jgi:hypothetical protein
MVTYMPTYCKPEATYIDMHALSQRLRGKAMLLMDVDTDFACDLICASYFIDDQLPSRLRWIDEIVPSSVR